MALAHFGVACIKYFCVSSGGVSNGPGVHRRRSRVTVRGWSGVECGVGLCGSESVSKYMAWHLMKPVESAQSAALIYYLFGVRWGNILIKIFHLSIVADDRYPLTLPTLLGNSTAQSP